MAVTFDDLPVEILIKMIKPSTVVDKLRWRILGKKWKEVCELLLRSQTVIGMNPGSHPLRKPDLQDYYIIHDFNDLVAWQAIWSLLPNIEVVHFDTDASSCHKNDQILQHMSTHLPRLRKLFASSVNINSLTIDPRNVNSRLLFDFSHLEELHLSSVASIDRLDTICKSLKKLVLVSEGRTPEIGEVIEFLINAIPKGFCELFIETTFVVENGIRRYGSMWLSAESLHHLENLMDGYDLSVKVLPFHGDESKQYSYNLGEDIREVEEFIEKEPFATLLLDIERNGHPYEG